MFLTTFLLTTMLYTQTEPIVIEDNSVVDSTIEIITDYDIEENVIENGGFEIGNTQNENIATLESETMVKANVENKNEEIDTLESVDMPDVESQNKEEKILESQNTEEEIIESKNTEEEIIENIDTIGNVNKCLVVDAIVNNGKQCYNHINEMVVPLMSNSFEYTNRLFEMESTLLDNFNLKDKKITCFGDSITEGVGGIELTEDKYKGYCNYLNELTGAEVVNLGIGGAPIGDYWNDTALCRRWTEIPQDTDILIIFAGYNDFFIGKYKEFNNYVDILFSNLKNTYIDTEIFVVLPYHIIEEVEGTFAENNLAQYITCLTLGADKYSFNIIDLYNTNYMNTSDKLILENYASDGVHLNDKGYEMLALHLASCINNFFEVE